MSSIFDIDQFKPDDVVVNLDRDAVYTGYYDDLVNEFPDIYGHMVAEIIETHGGWATVQAVGFVDHLHDKKLRVWLEEDQKIFEINLMNVKLFVTEVINDPALYERTLL